MNDQRAGEHIARPHELELPSEWAMRELPARAATFLHAIGSHAPIRAAMQRGGYQPRDHEEGLRFLVVACALHDGGLDPHDDRAPRAAVSELQRWAAAHVPRLKAAVLRHHPDVASPLGGLDFSEPTLTVLSTATFLSRLDELDPSSRDAPSGQLDPPDQLDERSENEPREAESDSPDPVILTLRQRAFGRHERAQLAELVRVVQHAQPTPAAPGSALDSAPLGASERAQLELYRWYADWKTTAKSLIRRRDWQWKLGIRKRRTTKESD